MLTTDTHELYVGVGDFGAPVPLQVFTGSVTGLLGANGKVAPGLLPPSAGGSGADNSLLVVPLLADRDALIPDTDVFSGDLVLVLSDVDGRRKVYFFNGGSYVSISKEHKRNAFDFPISLSNLTTYEVTPGRIELSWANIGASTQVYDLAVELDGRSLRSPKGWEATGAGFALWVPTDPIERAHWLEVEPVYNLSWSTPAS